MKAIVLLVALTGLTSLVGCGNKVNFTGHANEGAFSEPPPIIDVPPPIVQPPPEEPPPVVVVPPPEPPPVEPPPVEPPPVVVVPPPEPPPVVPPPVEPPPVVVEPPPAKPLNMKAGTCSVGTGEKILSCLNCASKDPIPAPPILSRKAQELLDIMTAGCSIHNKSDLPGYVPPSHDELLKRVIQCSPTAYQDTAFQSTQASTINQLLHNPTAQRNAFGYLYYNAATTDFETYFGLDIGEARYTFCRKLPTFSNEGIYPKEYYDSLYSDIPYTLPPIYVKAQRIRNQLRNCLANSLANPNVNQPPAVPGETCSYESAEGEMGTQVVDKVHEWQKQGHTVYFEGFEQCGIMDHPEKYLDNPVTIKIAIKKCQ